VYGYPNEGGPRVMFYNKDLFAEAGITELPGDWEELREVAKKTTKYKGDMLTQQGIVTSWGPDGICVLGSFLYSNGGEWMSEDLTEPMFDQPESVEALKYWTELVTVDKVSSPAFVEDSFALGKSAMMVTGPWNIPHLTDVAPDLDYAAFLIPPKNKGDRFYVDDAPWVWMVNSNSKNQEESWKVLAFLHNNQNLVDYAIDAGGIPFKEEPIETLKGKLDTALPPKEAEVWKVFLESTKYSKLRPFRHYLDICFKFGAEMERALLGEITPEEAAKNGSDKIRQTIKEMGK
jgi:multiple sugar transport system substrate-binding protein